MPDARVTPELGKEAVAGRVRAESGRDYWHESQSRESFSRYRIDSKTAEQGVGFRRA
jgi:hypothetical protein